MLGPECDVRKVAVVSLGLLNRGWKSSLRLPMTAPNKSAIFCDQNIRRFARGKIVFDV